MALDPRVFSPDAIDDESRQLIEQLRREGAAQKPHYEREPQEIRDARIKAGVGPGGLPTVYSENAQIRRIAGPGGEVELRCFIPEKIDGAYLYIHGGGWVLGDAAGSDPRLEGLSNDFNLAVLSVEYRLAPENPYPAGPDDCEAAALWLAKNAASEFGTEKLLIAGDSAGANLAVSALVRLRDKHGITPYSGANLGWGVFDAAQTPSSLNWGVAPLILSTPTMKWYADNYAPVALHRDPDVSPLYADLHDMPRALFMVGTHDALLDDSTFMHARWLAAGNESELEVLPGGIHGMTAYPTALGRKAKARQDEFVKAVLAG